MKIVLAVLSLCALNLLLFAEPATPNQLAPSKEISLSAGLQRSANNGASTYSLIVEITNVTKNVKVCSDEDFGCQIFTLAEDGAWKPLRTRDVRSITRVAQFTIDPGQTVKYPFDLSSDELLLIQSRLTKCQFLFSNGTGDSQRTIGTIPKKFSLTGKTF